MTPKYRTDSLACSCPGYWFRRTCKHYRAYREAMALVDGSERGQCDLGYGRRVRKRRCTGL